MPKSMTDDVANVIVQALQRGLSRKDIAGVVGVSRRAITRISTNLRLHGAPKAPPSGLKQGRPIKMTEAQANAMLGWIAGRNHTFFIKDLTQFLKDNHGFKGCDGTVRRALIRAGYKRKLLSLRIQYQSPNEIAAASRANYCKPWHKSEITAWVPPDGPPDLSFVMHVNNTPRKPRPDVNAAPSNSNNTGIRTNHDVSMSEEPNRLGESTQTAPDDQSQSLRAYHLGSSSGIDPALEAATIPPPARFVAQYLASPTNAEQSHVPSTEPVGSPRHSTLASPSHQTTNSPISPPTDPQIGQSHSASLTEGLASKAARSYIRNTQAISHVQEETPPQHDTDTISSLQQENARQRELIAQLQRQLAQGSPTPTAAALAESAATAAATATAAMHVQNQQQHEQQQQQATPSPDEQPAAQAKIEQPEESSSSLAGTTSERVRRLQALIDSRGTAQGLPRHTALASNGSNQNDDGHDESGEEDDDQDDDDDDAV